MDLRVRKILVANDLSPEASGVVRYALELGCKFNAQVHVLHVMPTVEPSVLNMVALTMGADNLAKHNKASEREMVEETRKQLKAIIKNESELLEAELDHPPKVEVCHGEPVSAILDTADRLDADMVILGSHSKGLLRQTFLGRTAERVLRKSHRIVTIVPPPISVRD